MKTSLHHQLSSDNSTLRGSAKPGGRSASSRFTFYVLRLAFPSRSTTHQSAIALVVTLILLAIITFMTVTLLVVTRSEKGSVVVTQDQTTATLAAEAAQERVKMQLIAPMLAFTNPYTFDLLVSTNYINPLGFITGLKNPTNVSYTYANGKFLNANDSVQNLLDLLYDPPAPVYMTNRLAAPFGSNEFRSYIDLNRNRRFDATGSLPVQGLNGNYLDTNGNSSPTPYPYGSGGVSNYFSGDPQWIGQLEKPGSPHSPTNRFISRYAYIAIPLSKALDLNYIYDYTKARNINMAPGSDSFFRNMGVGTWEINLAAFLVDLNTNYWQFIDHGPASLPYTYYATGTGYLQPNTGIAFEDALSLLRYRYAANWRTSLLSVRALFGQNGALAFPRDGIDGYTRGPAMIGTTWQVAPDNDQTSVNNNIGWAGSDNPNHFFSTQDLFDPGKTAINVVGKTFTDRLVAAGTNASSYDRYTLYRMLAQLGTDSAPESGKVNLNYANVDNGGNVVPNMATNFISWNAVQFFTNVAIRLMTNAGFAVGPNNQSHTNILYSNAAGAPKINIQIWPTNYYAASIHRLLQVAANLYDATTNRTYNLSSATNGFPTVFRPIFSIPTKPEGRIFITGFQEVTNADMALSPPTMRDLNLPADRQAIRPFDMVYGVPLIIGAKKGFPNFNEFSMQTAVTVTRKLQFFSKQAGTLRSVYATNQMYVVTISNVFGLEAWNSYSNAYPRNLRMIVGADMNAVVTNQFNPNIPVNFPPVTTNFSTNTTIAANSWSGFVDINHAENSFRMPLAPSAPYLNSFLFLTNSTYNQAAQRFFPLTGVFEQGRPLESPHWWLTLNTRVRYFLVDTEANRIVDYVNLRSADDPVDITYELMDEGQNCSATYNPPHGSDVPDGMFWCTNGASPSSLNYGTRLQIDVSGGLFSADWKKSQNLFPGGLSDENSAKDFFRSNFFNLPPKFSTRPVYPTNLFYSPFNPSRTLYITTSWQANDPLVHYTIGDLLDLQTTNRVSPDSTIAQQKISNIRAVNERYEPWTTELTSHSSSPTRTLLSVKDPLVTRSDDWDFPTNKFPNIGWIGRVHRGTPWQTVYLKPFVESTNWLKWTGNGQIVTNFGQLDTNIVNLPISYPATNRMYDAQLTFPTNDWAILDLFTTAFNDNAARGRLGINQSNLAAWSAIFSGVIALQADTNGISVHKVGTNFPAVAIEPVGATNNSPLLHLVTAINDVRRTNFAGAFRKLGDILAVPEYTYKSPFMNQTNVNLWNVNDAVCERLPQQTLGLLNLEAPRFLIYSWGQALKPANKSILTSGSAFGLCTNYQVTAESAVRAVVRVDGLNERPPNPHVVIEKYNILPPD